MKTFSQFFVESEVRGAFDSDPGSKKYQDALMKARQKNKNEKAAQNIANADAARTDMAKGIMRGSKNGVSGHFKYNQATKRFDIFVPGQPD